MRIYGTISKTEEQPDGTLIVEGIASSEARDSQGEVITADAMKAALPDYMAFANVREMHDSKKAAGVAVECEVIDGNTILRALIVDPVACDKVRHKVYKGFSIGGRVTSRDENDRTIITGLRLGEISLVDRPANPDALLTCYKSDSPEDQPDEDSDAAPESVEGEPAASAKADGPGDEEELTNAPEAVAELVTLADGTKIQLTKAADGSFTVNPVPDEEELTKGSYSISQLADLCERLESFASCRSYDCGMDGSNAPTAIPDEARKLAMKLWDLLLATVGEDAAAARERLKAAKKSDDDGDLAKLANDGDLQKAFDVLKAENEDLINKYTELKTKYDAAPADGKAVLREVAKSAETLGAAGAVIDDVTKYDPLALIKKAHASGGNRLM